MGNYFRRVTNIKISQTIGMFFFGGKMRLKNIVKIQHLKKFVLKNLHVYYVKSMTLLRGSSVNNYHGIISDRLMLNSN